VTSSNQGICCDIGAFIAKALGTRLPPTKMRQKFWANESKGFVFNKPIRNLLYDVSKADPHKDEAESISTNQMARICLK
jgi:hypothetical protein